MAKPLAPLNLRRLLAALPHPAVLVFALAAAVGSYLWLPRGGHDWSAAMGPAARVWFTAPWEQGWPAAPWAALIVSPLGAMPDRIATAFINGASVIALAVAIRALGGRDWMALPLLVSPLGYWLFSNGQVDTLILLSLVATNGLELLIVTAKPQVAVGLLVSRLRRAGASWPAYLAPLVLGGLLSLLIWPGWLSAVARASAAHVGTHWNSSLWPYGLPFGLALLWGAWRRGDDGLALMATPLLFPFVNAPSYLGALAAVSARWPQWVLWAWGATMALTGWLLAASARVSAAVLAVSGGLALIAVIAVGVWLAMKARRTPLQLKSSGPVS